MGSSRPDDVMTRQEVLDRIHELDDERMVLQRRLNELDSKLVFKCGECGKGTHSAAPGGLLRPGINIVGQGVGIHFQDVDTLLTSPLPIMFHVIAVG